MSSPQVPDPRAGARDAAPGFTAHRIRLPVEQAIVDCDIYVDGARLPGKYTHAAPERRFKNSGTIALAPLSDSEIAALVSELLGQDPSIGRLGQTIAERAAGNPFFRPG